MNRLIAMMVAVLFASTTLARKAFVLTEENFEHDTQMMGGATTGDWLVLFCEGSHKKKECASLKEWWDEFANELAGRVTVAYVDT